MQRSLAHLFCKRACVTAVAVGLWIGFAAAPAWSAPAERDLGPALTPREQAFHVLNRLAFGPRPGDVDRVMEMGWEAWAREQLEPQTIDADALFQRVTKQYPSLTMTLDQAVTTYRPPYRADETPEEQQRRSRLRTQIQKELRDAVLTLAAESPRQFEEVILEFWRNHFNIDQNKDDIAFMAPDFERSVLRRHAFGRFEDMLLASATHPAMLTYLDNAVSQKPLTEREQRMVERYENRDNVPRSVQALGRQRGLNENYARELMELHTLGVDRQYRQRDVTELARILTGWSVGETETQSLGFVFRENVHDDNPKRLFGSLLRGGGLKQGVSVIRNLAGSRYTADFISYKLCRYLVRDEPSEALVQDVTKVFQRTDGDLSKVYAAIIFSDDFMFRQNHRVKFKTPFEFTVSTLRATGASVEAADAVHYRLGRMGQPTYRCEDPTGYYDQAEAWLDPGVLLHRWNFALALGNNDIDGVRVPDHLQANLSRSQLDRRLFSRLLPGEANPQTRAEVEAAFDRGGASAAWGVMLGSPDFQQQ